MGKLRLTLGIGLMAVFAACGTKEQRRDIGTVFDDQSVEVRVVDRLYGRPEFGKQDHIKAEVHNGVLLLAGETKSEQNKALATEIASDFDSIERVVNELEVMPVADSGGRFNNAYITSKINTKLTASNTIEGFDAGRIKVITAHGTVYLMGTVTRAEGDAVADVARRTGGVEKVVKVFDYID